MGIIHVVGNLTWDRLIEVPAFPEPNRDYLVLADAVHPGGAAGNVAAGLCMLSVPSAIVAAVGRDEGADTLIADIASYGVDISRVQRVDRATSELLCIIDPHGDRSFLLNPQQAAFNLNRDGLPAKEGDGYAFVGCRLATATRILDNSPVSRERTFANIGFWTAGREWTPGSARLLERLDCLFLNNDEYTALPDQVRAFITSSHYLDERRRVIVTGGAAEAMVMTAGGSVALAPSVPVDIVNTLGCGDAFMAGYLAAHIAGLRIERCLVVAHECAGRVAASPQERRSGQFDGIEVA
jgi:ribokinase